LRSSKVDCERNIPSITLATCRIFVIAIAEPESPEQRGIQSSFVRASNVFKLARNVKGGILRLSAFICSEVRVGCAK
jgi:hypothetical protein